MGTTYRYDHGTAGFRTRGFEEGYGASYEGTLTYEFNDLLGLTFTGGRRLHDAAGAVLEKIRENYLTARLDYIAMDRLRLGLFGPRSLLSDDNDYWDWGFDGNYRLDMNRNYRDTLLFAYSYGHYGQESDIYDSPYRRVDGSFGISRLWSYPRLERTWEFIQLFGWGHDNDEGKSFSPSSRIEFVQSFSNNSRLTVGFTMAWYTNQRNDADNRRSNGYTFDIAYMQEW